MGQPERILLIDDDPAVLLTVGDRLKLEGYDVLKAASGDQALATLRTETPDLIILDITMPGMSGLAFLKKISMPDGRPRYPVLVFTARSNMETFFAETAVEGFLSKTSDPQRLIDETRRILDKTLKGSAGRAGRRRLLIVEDDEHLRTQLARFFAAAGFETASLDEGSALNTAVTAQKPDVVLIKQILPKQNGAVLAAALGQSPAGRGVRVILYDDSGIQKPDARFPHVDRFVPSRAPADLLKAVTALAGVQAP